MYQAKDGKRFGSNEMGKHYDKTRAKEADRPGEEQNAGGDGEEQGIADVVEQHGPAHTSMIKKQDGSEYHVHTTHEDGSRHVSKGHKSAHEAHQHSMHAMTGEEPAEHEEPDADDEEAGSMASSTPRESAPAIPGM